MGITQCPKCHAPVDDVALYCSLCQSDIDGQNERGYGVATGQLMTPDQLIDFLNQGNKVLLRGEPYEHPRWQYQSEPIAGVKKIELNGEPTIQVRFAITNGPVHHVPCNTNMKFKLTSSGEVEVWKKGTIRYRFTDYDPTLPYSE
jgi:hypothetical protein